MSREKPIHIDRLERNWIVMSMTLLVIFAAAVTVAGFAMGIAVPAPAERVNPNTIAQDERFANPGLRELAPGIYEAYILAQATKGWVFNPKEITVPVGARVTFYVTTTDVQHGFKLQDTNVNMQIVPGHISKLSHTFNKAGTFNFICTEYCGTGHAIMYGKVIVTEP